MSIQKIPFCGKNTEEELEDVFNQLNINSDKNKTIKSIKNKTIKSIKNKISIKEKYDEKKDLEKFINTKISTKTIIVATSVKFNIEKLFEIIPITDYSLPIKKRGRKKRISTNDEKIIKKIIPNGSIICVKYREKIRGCPLKKKKKYDNKYFRNSLSVVMSVDKDKFINFKLSQNGKFQITGCKDENHAIFTVKTFWGYIKDLEKKDLEKDLEKDENKDLEKDENKDLEKDENNYIFEKIGNFKAIFMTVMTNIDFNLGFNINREMLDKHMNSNTDYKSLLETSFGYTGVNIKLPMEKKIEHKLPYIELIPQNNKWLVETKTYTDYLGFLKEFEKKKELNKKRWNTFLVFHSGNVIMSGLGKCYMKEHYKIFMKIIHDSKKNIEEKLEK